ncbi:CobW family GTP-binding protein [Jiella avicenniae]|uniref:GTP-binding protein n=1 Tax=Jiella avicenniae TaxID=2907202 RepID=A0A9X1P0S4_9HYPH|nr:GTP-binding protein [Jiella avicenniae]MCE7027976.1 GTP-binding protein [Jiella avicenniae]
MIPSGPASRSPVKLTLLTGFLGAGKTTLLNRLIGDAALANAAVVVNEFGEAAIDPLLIEAVSSNGVISLSNGCLCCTVRGELVDTLVDLAEGTGTVPERAPPERVVVETTGLADPAPILSALMSHPVLSQVYALDGVVTVVDGENGARTLAEHEDSRRQVAVADRIVLTKSDLASPDGLTGTRRAVGRLNPRAPIVDAATIEGATGILVGCGLSDALSRGEGISAWLGAAADAHGAASPAGRQSGEDDPNRSEPHAGHHHALHRDHAHGHDRPHDHQHRRDGIRSFSLETDRPVAFDAIAGFLQILAETAGKRILRMKGIVLLAENPGRPLVLHGVQGFMHPPAQLPAWPGPPITRIVLIGQGLDERYARDLFSAFTGGIAPDAADRTAIEDNPLAIPGVGFGR